MSRISAGSWKNGLWLPPEVDGNAGIVVEKADGRWTSGRLSCGDTSAGGNREGCGASFAEKGGEIGYTIFLLGFKTTFLSSADGSELVRRFLRRHGMFVTVTRVDENEEGQPRQKFGGF